MKAKFIFDNGLNMPNLNEGYIFKDSLTREDGTTENHIIELDLSKIQKKLNIEKEEAIHVAETVIKSIWRLKYYETR